MPVILAAILMTSSIATSSTGGNSAGPGGTVVQGASYSSSYVRTVMGGAGTTTIRIESNADGTRQVEERTIPPRTPETIEVRTQSRSAVAPATAMRAVPASALAVPPWMPSLGAVILGFIRSLLDPMAY